MFSDKTALKTINYRIKYYKHV